MGWRLAKRASLALALPVAAMVCAVNVHARSSGAGLIVFAQERTASNGDDLGTSIWVARPDGSMFKQIHAADCCDNEVSPRWSPDGRTIAVADDLDFFVMNRDGTHPRTVCDSCWSPAAWSPDGRYLVVNAYHRSAVGDTVIGILDLRARKLHPLLSTAKIASVPSDTFDWSPDGKWIAVVAGDAGRLWLVRPDGTGLRPLRLNGLVGGGIQDGPRWSPDGKSLLFSTGSAMYTMPSRGGTPTLIRPLVQDNHDAAWSPDGREIAYGNGGVYVLDLSTRRTRRIDTHTRVCSGPNVFCYGFDWTR